MTLPPLSPLLAQGALQFAFEKATSEGKVTILVLFVLSMFSWTIIITKFRQLTLARKSTRRFFEIYEATRDPLDIKRRGERFPGAPVFRLYSRGADELDYHLKNNPVSTAGGPIPAFDASKGEGNTDYVSRAVTVRISPASFEAVRVAIEEAAGSSALALEKGMIILSTAVAGGPFIGLLGTVWGVMETFSGIARANSASLTAMAPGVAGALIATVTGLLVAIPAMFAYNFMVTTIRAITQELDSFALRYQTQIEHVYVDNRELEDKIAAAIQRAERERSARTPAVA
jgi:biopolymer transport protein ExbB/TolQ